MIFPLFSCTYEMQPLKIRVTSSHVLRSHCDAIKHCFTQLIDSKFPCGSAGRKITCKLDRLAPILICFLFRMSFWIQVRT